MRFKELLEYKQYYHGTSSSNIPMISKKGFVAPTHFTTSIEDAEYYAATGGEWDLQKREEEWEIEHGYPPREEFKGDMWEMYKELYPANDYPVVISVNISDTLLRSTKIDAGADGGIVSNIDMPPSIIQKINTVEWD
jgi:hypothetical protein